MSLKEIFILYYTEGKEMTKKKINKSRVIAIYHFRTDQLTGHEEAKAIAVMVGEMMP